MSQMQIGLSFAMLLFFTLQFQRSNNFIGWLNISLFKHFVLFVLISFILLSVCHFMQRLLFFTNAMRSGARVNCVEWNVKRSSFQRFSPFSENFHGISPFKPNDKPIEVDFMVLTHVRCMNVHVHRICNKKNSLHNFGSFIFAFTKKGGSYIDISNFGSRTHFVFRNKWKQAIEVFF